MPVSSIGAEVSAHPRYDPTVDPRGGEWSPGLKVVFRFVFSYILLCTIPFPFNSFPGSIVETEVVDRFWFAVAQWAGTNVLHVAPTPQFANGMLADTNAGFVTLLLFVVIAALATIVWTALDRTRTQYRTAHELLRMYVRYYLALTMLAYGLDKVFLLQFSWSLPGPTRLALPLGNYSPFALMWTFMGYSPLYTIFAGMGEVIGGILLFSRRTTTLGALIICGVMANVVTMNMSYQIPVKIFSSLLLLLAIFLVAPDASRLFDVFVRNRPTTRRVHESPFPSGWMATPRRVLAVALPVFSVCWFVGPGLAPQRARARAPKSPLYGLYQVETFARNGTPITPSDSSWRRMVFESARDVMILTTDDSVTGFGTTFDTTAKTVTLASGDDASSGGQGDKNLFAYARPDSAHLELRGTLDGQAVVVSMRKIDLSKLNLNRGFRWAENGGFYR